MADRATGSKDDEREGGRREVATRPRLVRRSYIFLPLLLEAKQKKTGIASERDGRARCCHVHLLLSEIEPARAQRVPVRKSGILSIIRDPSFEPCSKYSPSSPFTATNPIRAVRRGRNSRGHRRSDGNGKL